MAEHASLPMPIWPAPVVLIGTGSRHKLEELRPVLERQWPRPARRDGHGAAPRFISLNDLPTIPPEPAETGDTLEANALIKARSYARASGLWTLSDDSGLFVDALGGLPGVHSAIYAGLPRDDHRNNALLLERLRSVPAGQRSARFVSVVVLCSPDGPTSAHGPWHRQARGEVEGVIRLDPAGDAGFGYDPLFALAPGPGVPPDLVGRTMAQVPLAIKNTVSHRFRAVQQLLAQLTAELVHSDMPGS